MLLFCFIVSLRPLKIKCILLGMQERLFHNRLLQRLRRGAARNGQIRDFQAIYKTITRGWPKNIIGTSWFYITFSLALTWYLYPFLMRMHSSKLHFWSTSLTARYFMHYSKSNTSFIISTPRKSIHTFSDITFNVSSKVFVLKLDKE